MNLIKKISVPSPYYLCATVIAIAILGNLIYGIRQAKEATPEELAAIINETPCAATAYRSALDPDSKVRGWGGSYPRGYKPLSLGEAKRLAANCPVPSTMRDNKKEPTEALNKQLSAISSTLNN